MCAYFVSKLIVYHLINSEHQAGWELVYNSKQHTLHNSIHNKYK